MHPRKSRSGKLCEHPLFTLRVTWIFKEARSANKQVNSKRWRVEVEEETIRKRAEMNGSEIVDGGSYDVRNPDDAQDISWLNKEY